MREALAGFRPLLVAGVPEEAARVREALLAGGGDATAIVDASGRALTRGDFKGVEILVYALAGDAPTDDDRRSLAQARRARVERVCVVVGSGGAPPGLPDVDDDKLVAARAGEPLPVERLVDAIAACAEDDDYVVASRLPVLRRAVAERIVLGMSRQNGVLGAAIFLPGADLPALTLNQVRMVFRIAGAYGESIDRDRAVELVGVLGAGFGFRALARQALAFVPGPGWALKGGVAYVGTRALGRAAIEYFERRARASDRKALPPAGGTSG